jgi:hypothetical protein
VCRVLPRPISLSRVVYVSCSIRITIRNILFFSVLNLSVLSKPGSRIRSSEISVVYDAHCYRQRSHVHLQAGPSRSEICPCSAGAPLFSHAPPVPNPRAHASRPLLCERRGLSAARHSLRRRVAARSLAAGSPCPLRTRTACPAAAGRRAGRRVAGSPCPGSLVRVRVRLRVRFGFGFGLGLGLGLGSGSG